MTRLVPFGLLPLPSAVTSGGREILSTKQTKTKNHKHMAKTKYSPEQIGALMAATQRYSNGGSVQWNRLAAENPELMAMADHNAKKLKQLYYRQLEGSPRSISVKWTPEEMTVLRGIAQSHRNTNGAIDWKRAQAEGVMAPLLARHSFKDITSRYHYEANKHKQYGKKRYQRRTAHTVNAPADEPVVIQGVATVKEVQTIDWCPHCGKNLQVFNRALRILSEM